MRPSVSSASLAKDATGLLDPEEARSHMIEEEKKRLSQVWH